MAAPPARQLSTLSRVYEQITLEVADHIATITLNRPDRMNAFTPQMANELIAAFDETDANDDVRVVIMTGAGRAFCAGADLGAGGSTFVRGGSMAPGDQRDGGGRVSLRIFNSVKPVIAAINGAAVGVGITMTLPADIRIAAETSKFGFVFTQRGIVPEACSSYFLPRLVGISQAMEWVATGRVFAASEALAGRLVRSVHAVEDVVPVARALAAEIALAAPVSVSVARQLLWRGLGYSHPMEAHRADSLAMVYRGKSADANEGISSFLEKRPADFPDRVSTEMPDAFPGWVEPAFKSGL